MNIINLDFLIERNNDEQFYLEQASINHLSKTVHCRQPISNRIFGKFVSDLTSLQFTFPFTFHPLGKDSRLREGILSAKNESATS